MRILALLLLSTTLLAADSGFNGQWNITIPNPRNRVWWLEVSGAGTARVAGSFVGAPGGQVDPLKDATVSDGELRFTFRRERQGKPLVLTYRARLVDGKLDGVVEEKADGESAVVTAWRGVRSAASQERDSSVWKAGPPVELINGKDLSGWRLLVPSRPGWRMENGILRNQEGSSDLVSERKFWNFILRAEYRYAKGSNSGVALRGRYEVQIVDDYGQPTSHHSHGTLYCRETPALNASLPPGEWQALEVRLVGSDLTVSLNGKKLLDRVKALPTAMAMNPAEDQPGPIVLQGDHGPVEFRRITILPLSPRP